MELVDVHRCTSPIEHLGTFHPSHFFLFQEAVDGCLKSIKGLCPFEYLHHLDLVEVHTHVACLLDRVHRTTEPEVSLTVSSMSPAAARGAQDVGTAVP